MLSALNFCVYLDFCVCCVLWFFVCDCTFVRAVCFGFLCVPGLLCVLRALDLCVLGLLCVLRVLVFCACVSGLLCVLRVLGFCVCLEFCASYVVWFFVYPWNFVRATWFGFLCVSGLLCVFSALVFLCVSDFNG